MTVFYRGRLVIEEVTDMPRDGDRYPTTTTHTLAELTITDPEGPFAVVTQMQNHTGELANHYGSKVDRPEGPDPTCTNTTHDHSTSSCLGPADSKCEPGCVTDGAHTECTLLGLPKGISPMTDLDDDIENDDEDDEDPHVPQAACTKLHLTKGNYEINANDPEDVPRRALIKPRPVKDNPQA